MKALDMQHGGRHYKGLGIQPTEYWKSNHLGADEGVSVKYVTRWPDKGGIEDLRKVRHHLQFILEDPEYMDEVALIAKLTKAGALYRNRITPEDYIRANGLRREEAGVIRCVTVWQHTGFRRELLSAIKWADDLIARELNEGEGAA